MRYQRFDPSACGFPRPKVSVLPPLGWASLGGHKPACISLMGSHAQPFSRARYALTEALRHCGLGPGTALLAPAYHCRTMIDPAIRLGAQVLLYPCGANLVPDLAALRVLLAQTQAPVKAMLVTHYFGFAQPMDALMALCQAHGIDVIEDCSHAMFAAPDGAMGRSGRFGVASPYKFFPMTDGGLLWANGEALPEPRQAPRPPSLRAELSAVLHSLRGEPATALQTDAQRPLPSAPRGADFVVEEPGVSLHYVESEEGLRSLTWSRWVMRRTDQARMVERRRQNYQRWLKAIANLPHCRALFPLLPDATVPYMFPLLIEQPELHFGTLKALGLPIWRWDDMAMSPCPVARDYRLHLLHLPCHQEVSEEQMDWMISQLVRVMRQTAIKGIP